MIELIVAHPHAFWLSLGGLLLAAEMLGGNGYLLWSGVAAVITGLLVWLIPLDWAWQGALFAVLTLVAAWLWWRWLSTRVKAQKPVDAHLNQRGQQIVGKRFTLAPVLNRYPSAWRPVLLLSCDLYHAAKHHIGRQSHPNFPSQKRKSLH